MGDGMSGRRLLMNTLTLASLLLCGSAAVLWYRSYRMLDYPKFELGRFCVGFHSESGEIRLFLRIDHLQTHRRYEYRAGPLGTDSNDNGVGGHYWGLTISLWLLVTALAVPGIWRGLRKLRSRSRYLSAAGFPCVPVTPEQSTDHQAGRYDTCAASDGI